MKWKLDFKGDYNDQGFEQEGPFLGVSIRRNLVHGGLLWHLAITSSLSRIKERLLWKLHTCVWVEDKE